MCNKDFIIKFYGLSGLTIEKEDVDRFQTLSDLVNILYRDGIDALYNSFKDEEDRHNKISLMRRNMEFVTYSLGLEYVYPTNWCSLVDDRELEVYFNSLESFSQYRFTINGETFAKGQLIPVLDNGYFDIYKVCGVDTNTKELVVATESNKFYSRRAYDNVFSISVEDLKFIRVDLESFFDRDYFEIGLDELLYIRKATDAMLRCLNCDTTRNLSDYVQGVINCRKHEVGLLETKEHIDEYVFKSVTRGIQDIESLSYAEVETIVEKEMKHLGECCSGGTYISSVNSGYSVGGYFWSSTGVKITIDGSPSEELRNIYFRKETILEQYSRGVLDGKEDSRVYQYTRKDIKKLVKDKMSAMRNNIEENNLFNICKEEQAEAPKDIIIGAKKETSVEVQKDVVDEIHKDDSTEAFDDIISDEVILDEVGLEEEVSSVVEKTTTSIEDKTVKKLEIKKDMLDEFDDKLYAVYKPDTKKAGKNIVEGQLGFAI